MATIFRLPLIFSTWRRDPNGVATAAQANVTENRNVALLLGKDTFFRGPGQAPNYDWPNPTLAKSSVVSAVFSQSAVWQNRLVNLLVGKDTFFRGPGQAPVYDWPNPTLAKSSIVSSVFSQAGVWQNRLVNLLVGKDTFFRGPGQAPNYDWPNPLRVDPGRFAAVQALVTQNLLGTLLAVTVAAAPFQTVDQPNPRGAVNRVALGSGPSNLLTTTLAGQDAIYGSPGQVPDYDWPNPAPRPSSQAAVNSLTYVWQNLANTLLAAGAPFSQDDWPNPRGPASQVAISFVQQDLFGSTLAGQDSVYGAPGQVPDYDWQNPRGAVNRVALDFVQQYLFSSTLQALPAGTALGWSNPWGPANRVALNFVQQNLFGFTLQAPPVGASLWPQPSGPTRSLSNDSPPNLLNTLLAPTQATAPFFQTNWPLSQRLRGVPGECYTSPLALLTGTTPPPPPSDVPESGFVANVGRMMIRRG